MSLLFATFFALLQAASPGVPGLDVLVDGVQRTFARMKDFSADFVQIENPLNQKQQESGHLYLMKPRMMRWEYKNPEDKLFISDGKMVYFYIPAERQVSRDQVKDTMDDRIPLMFLVGRSNLRDEFTRFEAPNVRPLVEGTRVVKMYPKRKTDLKELVMEVDPRDFVIRRLVMTHMDDSVSDLRFSNVRTNTGLNASFFKFEIPKGTTILEGLGQSPAMEFTVKYAKPTGEIVKMVQVGQNADEVRHRLQEQGYLPISVAARGFSLGKGLRRKQDSIDTQDFIIFNQQFVALIKAGLPILRSLDLLRVQLKNPVLKRHITDVRDQVHSGILLSEALRAQGVFPTVYTASIFAGERSGNLVEVINRYVHYEKTILTVRKRFLGSLIYPAFLIVLSIVMVLVVVTFVIPRFGELYAGLNTPLPLATRILIAVSVGIQHNILILAPAVVGAVLGLLFWAGTPGGRDRIDQFKLSAPIVGHLWTMFSMAQLSRTLSTLLQGGIPLLAALEVAREASGNRIIASSISQAIGSVREGQALSDSMEKSGHFPDLAMEMMRVGEQTGSLPEMLNHVADFYDEDVDIRTTALLSWIEPVILVFVAVFIAAILISLYLPIFSINGAVGG